MRRLWISKPPTATHQHPHSCQDHQHAHQGEEQQRRPAALEDQMGQIAAHDLSDRCEDEQKEGPKHRRRAVRGGCSRLTLLQDTTRSPPPDRHLPPAQSLMTPLREVLALGGSDPIEITAQFP